MKYFILIVSLSIMFSGRVIFSQWSSNPAQNLQVCDVTGAQELPKIVLTSDGGCYISWFDNRSGSYAVYLQRLNELGIKQFAEDGLLISNNSQSTSLVDYALEVDDSSNAIIVFTDTRNGSQINPFAYKVSPSGNFLWGNNGVQLSNEFSVYQPNPKAAVTSDNAVVFTWIYSSTPNKIAFQKLSPGGEKLWGADPILLSGSTGENFTYPAVVRSDNNAVIALWSGYTGTFINPGNYRLYTQKFSSTGIPVWNATQDTVYSLGRVSGFFVPKLISDKNNGALYVWQDDRDNNNLQSSFVQHYNSAGAMQFPLNGAEGSVNPATHKFDAWASYMNATGETYMFWKEANSLQSLFGTYGQKLSSDGTRQWTGNGKEFYPLNQNSIITTLTLTMDTSVYVYFNEGLFGSGNNILNSFKCDRSGNFLWSGNIIVPASSVGSKSRLGAVINQDGMSILTWSDGRQDGGGIYAQNINADGSFGGGVNIQNIGSSIPDEFKLYQNYPNPFNPSTKIKFSLPVNAVVSLKLYNISGKEVRSLMENEIFAAGEYEYSLEMKELSSGIYFYILSSAEFKETKKMILLR
jgi:hypothetical protein